ncbi:HIT family hydrolase [uncultured Campylobacter sp.]|uniref:HIT family hydrolase n=1 Tax=uncultured Campylobacter sp. TaxID=218934 RepID=UPI0028E5CBB8|nr:HIT family hydrolase [uncultured Campylobacter sp.]
MTENDAIEALMGAFDEGQDTASEEPTQANEPQEAKGTNEAPVAQAPKETPKSEEATPKQSAPAVMTPEQQAMLESMGLGDIGQIKEQLAQFQAAQAAAAEQARQQEIFNKNSAEFKKDFPTIKLEELGKFADENGFMPLLGENYDGWKAVAKAMIGLAKVSGEPDPIIGSNRGAGGVSAFERVKKGENVSDIELGAEILKSAGML